MRSKKKAVAQTTTKNNKQHSRVYLKTIPLSSLKEQIGQLLLNLQNQNEPQYQWQNFDSKLRRYIDLNYCRGNYHG